MKRLLFIIVGSLLLLGLSTPHVPVKLKYPGKLAFTSHRDGASNIWIMNFDGSEPKNITNNAASNYFRSWSPDGQQIAWQYQLYVPDLSKNAGSNWHNQIHVMNADGSHQINLTHNLDGDDFFLTWSPDGQHIAFLSCDNVRCDLSVVRPDGSALTHLTNNIGSISCLGWLPDSQHISIMVDQKGEGTFYIVNVDGSHLTRLGNNHEFTCRSFSPNGEYGAYLSPTRQVGKVDLQISKADGSNSRTLATIASIGPYPRWSPDGNYIVVTDENPFNKNGFWYVAIINADGSGSTNITEGFGPSWGR